MSLYGAPPWYRYNIDYVLLQQTLRDEVRRHGFNAIVDRLGFGKVTVTRLLHLEREPSIYLMRRVEERLGHPRETFTLFTRPFVVSLLVSYAILHGRHRIPKDVEALPRPLVSLVRRYPYRSLREDALAIVGRSHTRRISPRKGVQQVSDHQLLERLRAYYATHGRPPRQSDGVRGTETIIYRFHNRDVSHPLRVNPLYRGLSPNAVRSGWNRALILAGIPLSRMVRQSHFSDQSRETS